tara:strand:- start:73 stop:255 length:183 start_codon:yes stop_codon:yes gene_type:complete
MRQEKDGDIEPTIEDMRAAKKMLTDLLELVGEDDEHASNLKNDIEQLENDIKEVSSQAGT